MINQEIFNQYLTNINTYNSINHKSLNLNDIIKSNIQKFSNKNISKINNPLLTSKILMLTSWKLTNVNNHMIDIICVNMDSYIIYMSKLIHVE